MQRFSVLGQIFRPTREESDFVQSIRERHPEVFADKPTGYEPFYTEVLAPNREEVGRHIWTGSTGCSFTVKEYLGEDATGIPGEDFDSRRPLNEEKIEEWSVSAHPGHLRPPRNPVNSPPRTPGS